MKRGIVVLLAITCSTLATQVKAQSDRALSVSNENEFQSGLFNNRTERNSVLANIAAPAVLPITTAKTIITEACKALQVKYAMLMNRDIESISNTSLYEKIDEWMGTRYRFGGTTKKGIDCSAFTATIMSSIFEVFLPRTAREQYAATNRVRVEEMMEGDLVFFNTRGGVSHVGLYLGDGYFVHASSSQGVAISNLADSYYHKRFIGGGRVAGQGLLASLH